MRYVPVGRHEGKMGGMCLNALGAKEGGVVTLSEKELRSLSLSNNRGADLSFLGSLERRWML